MMRRHSPYNYAFNNPVFFIDPDGMAPTDSFGMSTATGSVDIVGGFDVNTLDRDNNILSTEYHGNVNDANTAASEIKTNMNNTAYQSYFRNVAEYAANADLSLEKKPSESNPFYATIIIDKSV